MISTKITWHLCQVICSTTPLSFKRGKGQKGNMQPKLLQLGEDPLSLFSALCCLSQEGHHFHFHEWKYWSTQMSPGHRGVAPIRDLPTLQIGQLPHALGHSTPRQVKLFNICLTLDPFFIQMASIVWSIPNSSRTCEQHTILYHRRRMYDLKRDHVWRLARDTS